MRIVRDIMSPIVFCVEETASLPEAAQALHRRSISGAPVINDRGEYVGIVSQTDINARLAEAAADNQDKPPSVDDCSRSDIETALVRQIMSANLLKVSADATLEELGESLLIAGVHRMLVVDGGEVVGLVSTTDLIHGFLNPEGLVSRRPRRPTRKPYLFETELTFNEGVVRLNASSGSEILIEQPPEFGGQGRHATPEDLLVASLNSCLCLTFAEFARDAGLVVKEYNCRAIGRLEGDGVSLRFTRIDLYPQIIVDGALEKAEKVLDRARMQCLISRSTSIAAVVHPRIEVQSRQRA